MAERRTDGISAAPHVEVSETHAALVLFVDDRAYKIKKGLDLGFLDFSTRKGRWAACTREVELNRRFAPDVYEGVAELRMPGAAEPEPLVVMRRMPPDRRLSHLVTIGAPVGDALREVAGMLAACHADSPHGDAIARQGTRDALAGRWGDSFLQMHGMDARTRVPLDRIEDLVRGYLAGRKRLFDIRVGQDRIVDGHGDLIAQDIFCLDDGPRILDCLEFDDALRYVDGFDDAAFLAMDLERLGAVDEAALFLASYSEYSGDRPPDSLKHHYIAYRALVRAKVALIRHLQGAPRAGVDADRLMDLALRHLNAGAVRLVLVGGPPGSGKSTVAGAVADRFGLTLLSSDRVRKELAGIPAEEPAPAAFEEGIYSPQWTRRTYGELIDRAEDLLSVGESVVLDATWTRAAQRAAAEEVARRCSADVVPLCCTVPRRTAADRLRARRGGTSDAGPVVGEAMAAAWEPWPQAVTLDTSRLSGALARAGEAVMPQGPRGSRAGRVPHTEPG